MRAEFLDTRAPAWSGFLAAVPHDFYHLPGYVDLCARLEGGRAAAFLVQDGGASMLAPLVLRPIPGGGGQDASAPYGYPAPLLRGAPVPEQVEGFLGAFAEAGAGQGIVSAFFRLHPLLPLPAEPFRRRGRLVDHGETVFLDLDLPREELDRQTRANHRADARKLQGQGYQVVLDAWDRLEDFAGIYAATMVAHAAGSGYRFDLDYFRALRECLGTRLHLCMVLDPLGRAAAGGLFTRVGGLMQFHLAGTAEAFRRAGPSKLMLIRMRDLAKAWGVRWLHLGGGVGCAEDSLAFFKQGFSPLRARFSTFRMVLQPAIYADLAALAQGRPSPDPDFFPAYRRP